jgi:hypothetical protein
MNRLLSNSVCVLLVLLCVGTLAFSQNNSSPTGAPSASAPTHADSGTAAEREKIWNSPAMLRARAWVQEYCERSAKVTPEEAKAYMTELENLSPAQMKLWLLKWEHDEEQVRQQQASFDKVRQAHLNQALSVNRATQEETQAAQAAQRSIDTQQQQAFERGLDKQQDLNSYHGLGYGGFSPYGYYGGMYPWLPGYAPPMHVHVHVH